MTDDRADQRDTKARHRPEVRRQMLLEAARTVIAERGLPSTTVRDIATAGGVAVGTVTYHFAKVEQMLAEVMLGEMTSYSDPVWQHAAQARDGAEGLAFLVDGLLASDERTTEHWRLWLDFWALAAHHPQYSEWQAQVYRDLHGLTESILVKGAADGTLVVGDPVGEAIELIAMLDGLVIQAYLPRGRLSPARARAVLHGYIATTMGGRRAAPAAPVDGDRSL